MDSEETKVSRQFVVSLDNFPDVVLIEIFKNLNYIELCKCSQVCCRWYKLTHSSGLRKNIVIESNLHPQQVPLFANYQFHKDLESFQYLNGYMLHPTSVTDITKEFLPIAKSKCSKLKKLALVFCNLVSTFRDMPVHLQCLNLRKCEINPYEFFGVRPQFYVPYLTCLDVSNVNFLTSQDLHIFRHFKSLRCLYLEDCIRINNGGIESITGVIEHLEVLDVEGTDIYNEGVELIIAHGLRLKELYLGNLEINDLGFQGICSDKHLNLQIICVQYTLVTPAISHKFSKCKLVGFSYPSCYKNNYEHYEPAKTKPVDFSYSCHHFLSHSCP